MTDFAYIILGAVLGTLLSILATKWTRGELGLRGELAGQWVEVVAPGRHKDYERRDSISIRHRRNRHRFRVHIQRTLPENESDRAWFGQGYVSGNDLLVMAYPAKPVNESSFGVIVLHRVHEKSGGWFWRGSYLRPATDVGREATTGMNLLWTEVTWKRK